MERALCPVLIGREEQLSLLEDALLAAHRGEGQMVVLAGEAGMGKTRLATELQKRALKGGTVAMWGGCAEAELSLPYLPFLEAIGNYLRSVDVAQLRERLGPVRRELAHLFPQLESERVARDVGDPTENKLRLFEAVLALLNIPADEHGLLVVVEDLHWAEASTRELLDYLTRRLRNMRVMVLATYRQDELHRKHPLLPMVQGWRRAAVAQLVELTPLSPPRVADMVSAIFDREQVGAEFRDFIHARSEGNPFVLEELLKAALDQGGIFRTHTGWDRKALDQLKIPPTVRDTILLRVERLSEEQAEILRTAAVLGPSFEYETLVAVAGRDKDSVQAALHAFVQQQLMEESPQARARYRFRHALTREAVYEDLIAPKREELHARAAQALRELPGTPAVDLAHHLLAANRWQEAIPVCIKAAEEAERRRAYREAADLFLRVLPHLTDGLTRGQIMCRVGRAWWMAGDPSKAQPYLDEGVHRLEESGQMREAAKYRLTLGRCHWERSRQDLARIEYARARASLEPAGPSEDLAIAYVRLAGLHSFDLEFAEALALAEKAVAVAEAAKVDPPRIWAYIFLGTGMAGLGQVQEGLEYLDRSYREAVDRDLDHIAANALFNAIGTHIRGFRAREALTKVKLLHEHQTGDRRVAVLASLAEGRIYGWALGEPEKARRALEESLELAREIDASTWVIWNQIVLAAVYGTLGRFDEGLRELPARDVLRERQDLLPFATASVRLHLDAGDLDRSVQEARQVPGLVEGRRHLSIARLLVDTAVEALLKAGQIEDADQLVTGTPMDGAGDGDPYGSRMEGRLALARGDISVAVNRLGAAADFLDQVGYRLEESRTRRLLAEAHARGGDRAAAETELRRVIAYADEFGAVVEGQRAREQLAQQGIHVEAEPPASAEADVHQASERLVTVLFVDVRGYSAMTGQQAPSEIADKVAAFQRWAKQEIERHHGLVDKFAGDAVMATFNVSGVRLDHCLHAVQAALAIRDKAAYAGLPVGVGIAVGPAVVGQLTEGANLTVLGETTNLAARLQAQAQAGQILLSAEAFRRTQEWLNAHEVEAGPETLELKGFMQPVGAFRLAAPKGMR